MLRTLVSPTDADVQMRVVVWDIRMPMAMLAVTVGASLSLAGAQMQTILANPLASPFTLGLSAAASFGAALAMVLGVGRVQFLNKCGFRGAGIMWCDVRSPPESRHKQGERIMSAHDPKRTFVGLRRQV